MASSCLDVTGSIDLSTLGLGCNTAPITGSRAVAGTFTANADGTYVDQTTTSGEEQITLPQTCLNVSGTEVRCEQIGPVIMSLGYDSAICASAQNGTCLCDVSFTQSSGLGVPSFEPLQSGTFTTSGHTFTLNDGINAPTTYQYCSSGGQVELLPLAPATGNLRGKIRLGEP